MTYRGLLTEAVELLRNHEIEDAEIDAKLLLMHLLGWSRADWLMHMDEPCEDEAAIAFLKMIERRAAHEPVQYITGTAPFFGYEFKVCPDVLIPRFDTETLVEAMLPYTGEGKKLLDLCTGSGCVLITLLLESKGKMEGTGADISPAALRCAAENAASMGVDAGFIESDVYTNLSGIYDIITANPPYIRTDVIGTLAPEVRDHEPMLALDGFEDGLALYRRIITGAPEHLVDGGVLGFEIGYDQGPDVADLMTREGFTDVEIIKDLSGNDRVVKGVLVRNDR